MGIEASLHQVTLFQLKRIQKDHELIEKWIFPEDEDDDPRVMTDEGLYLGKTLYALNFLISDDHSGGEPPESYAVFGKHLLFEGEGGLHFCGYLVPDEVKQVWSDLGQITKDDLLSRFDVDLMNSIRIYPGWRESDFDDLYDLFTKMLAYYQDTVHRNNAMIHIVC